MPALFISLARHADNFLADLKINDYIAEIMDFFEFDGVDEKALRRERAKARELRQSRWWKTKVAKGECYYCHGIFPPAQLCMDHIVPLARGGRSTKDNLVCCCKECNTKKKTMLPMEWEELIRRQTTEDGGR